MMKRMASSLFRSDTRPMEETRTAPAPKGREVLSRSENVRLRGLARSAKEGTGYSMLIAYVSATLLSCSVNSPTGQPLMQHTMTTE